jgi:CheY-like chemotaxis protein
VLPHGPSHRACPRLYSARLHHAARRRGGVAAGWLDSEREKAIATGCDEFDAKPIEFEGLIATIQRVLGNRK